MTDFALWITLIGLAITTIASRGIPLLLPTRWQLPPRITAALRYAPMAGLTAILMPDIFLGSAGELAISPTNLRLWAVVLALVVWFRWKSTVLALLVSGGFYVAIHLI
jgi:branched-subunit amino acid transport protein